MLEKNNIKIQKKKRVLIVDDNLQVARSIKRVLNRNGFETAIASDGFQVSILMGSYSPIVLTLDLMMPGANGLDVIQLIRDTKYLTDTKILVVSGMTENELHKALYMGADDILEKPFKNETLVSKVAKLAKLASLD